MIKRKVIRQGVFETNSSSTHSLVVLPKDSSTHNLFIDYNNNVLSGEEANEFMQEWAEDSKDWLPKDVYDNLDFNNDVKFTFYELSEHADSYDHEFIMLLDDWLEEEEMDLSITNITTPKGEEITIYSKTGWNG